VILADAAARIKQIQLNRAVTVLSADESVRVFQSFATLDLISEIVPRGGVTSSGGGGRLRTGSKAHWRSHYARVGWPRWSTAPSANSEAR